MGKSGVALQWATFSDTDYDCNIIGHYDSSSDDLFYSLLDSSNPTKGVSMKYPSGDSCYSNGVSVKRSATIDIQCSNTPLTYVSAQEPSLCQYHLVMKSFYGCPIVSYYYCCLIFT